MHQPISPPNPDAWKANQCPAQPRHQEKPNARCRGTGAALLAGSFPQISLSEDPTLDHQFDKKKLFFLISTLLKN
jgi:hypothetical protein